MPYHSNRIAQLPLVRYKLSEIAAKVIKNVSYIQALAVNHPGYAINFPSVQLTSPANLSIIYDSHDFLN